MKICIVLCKHVLVDLSKISFEKQMIDLKQSLKDKFCSRSKKKHPTKENGIETKQPPPQLAIAITTMPPPIINHSQRVTQQHYPYPLAAAHILFLKYASKYAKSIFMFSCVVLAVQNSSIGDLVTQSVSH